jgi:hypothetical protein
MAHFTTRTILAWQNKTHRSTMKHNYQLAVCWVVAACSLALIALMIVAASTSETSVNFYQIIRGNNPEDGHLAVIFHRERVYFILPSRKSSDSKADHKSTA